MELGLGLGLTRGASTVFNPLSVGPNVWYDPSDLSTLFQDVAGTTPVTADGQSVARVNDKSGNGKHWTQTTAANRPLYKTSGGLHWLQFDGVNDYLFTGAGMTWSASSDAFWSLQTTDTTFVLDYEESSSVEFLGCADNGSAGAQHLAVGSPTFLVDGASAGSTRDTLHDAISSATPRVVEAQAATLAIDSLAFGGYTGFQFTGNLYGHIIAPAAAGTRAAVRTYLGAKAGITV